MIFWSEGLDLSKVKPGFYGGDGTSQKRAVIAVGLDYSAPRWIAQKYPGSAIQGKIVDVWFQLLGGLSDIKLP